MNDFLGGQTFFVTVCRARTGFGKLWKSEIFFQDLESFEKKCVLIIGLWKSFGFFLDSNLEREKRFCSCQLVKNTKFSKSPFARTIGNFFSGFIYKTTCCHYGWFCVQWFPSGSSIFYVLENSWLWKIFGDFISWICTNHVSKHCCFVWFCSINHFTGVARMQG